MSIKMYAKRRSIRSYLVEKFLFLIGVKNVFTTPERTKKFIIERGMTNDKPYEIGNTSLVSEVTERSFQNMQVFVLNEGNNQAQKVILYLHGGGWTNQPLSFHWRFVDRLAQTLDAKVIVPIYPKVPHFNAGHAFAKLLALYKATIETISDPKQLVIMGDSAGGNLSLGLVQLLKREQLPQPKEIIVLSACVDMTFENPAIPGYEKKDPLLSAGGIAVITERWADGKTLTDPLLSPIYGDFTEIAPISHFLGTHESLYPDGVAFDKKLTDKGIAIDTFVYPKMNHVFVLMPIPEAKDAFAKIKRIIQQ